MFALEHRVRKETDALLFINKLRFDVAAHTVVCNAFVLALSQDIAQATLSTNRTRVIPIHEGYSRAYFPTPMLVIVLTYTYLA